MNFIPVVSALALSAVLAQGQTFYWHRDPALSSAGGIGRSYNWTANQDGTGQRPASLADDQFDAPELDTVSAWKFLDKDGVAGTGEFQMKGGKLILSGQGEDITKERHFFTGVHRTDIKGVFDVTVRVDSQFAAHDWSKAGIIMSNSLENFALGGTALVALTPKQGVIFETSPNSKGYIDNTIYPNLVSGWPVWLRLVKGSSTISAWYRTDSTAAWKQVGGQEMATGMATDSDVGLFVTSVDSVGKTPKTTAAAFDDFRGGSDIASSFLDLRFDGTGTGHDVDVIFAGNFAARSLDFTSFPGKLTFVSHTLTVSGSLRLSPAMSIVANTGAIEFTGATGPDSLYMKPNDTLPAIRKTGAGKLVLMSAPLEASSLRIDAGILDFNGNNADFGGLNSTGGSMEGLAANGTLTVSGNADFSGLTGFNSILGNVVIKSMGNSTTKFDPGGKTFPKVTLWTLATSTAKTTIIVGPGSLTTLGGLVFRNQLATTGWDGILDFRTNSPSVTIGGDLVQVQDGIGSNSQILLLGNGAWTAMGTVGLSLEAGGSGDSAVFHLAKPSGTQTLAITKGPLYAVIHDGAGTMKLASNLSATHLSQSSGALDFNGFNLALKGNLKVENGGPSTMVNLAGRTLTIDGNASFAGKTSGLLALNPATAWILKVKGTLTADSADIANSDASGSAKGIAAKGCNDGGKNLNWQFWAPPAPPVIVRDPVDVVVKPGWKASFTVAASGSPLLSYEWKKQGDTAVLSRDTVLTLDSVLEAWNNNAYYCVVANDLGKDTTRQAILSVRACDSSFKAPADIVTIEGGKVILGGKAGCASEVLWTPVSGPVPKLLDPQVDTLIFDAPRVKGDSTMVLQFSALFGGNWESKNVTVKVKDTIPDPSVALPVLPSWNGEGKKVIRPKIANAAELAKFPKYPLRYLWAVNPYIADSSVAGDSLVLHEAQEDGNIEISLCVDNGGAPSCSKAVVEVKRISLSLLLGRTHSGPVWLDGNRLGWNRPGLARVMDWRGRILWQTWGAPGSSAQLPAGAERSLRMGAARLDFLAVKTGR
ncbi:MAG: alpha-N-acetylglucosaminidase [Fibrobacteres bacterium]|nr:alpha-N-acetylglucosaminidase [Fibrobacterota bacterium]